MAPLHSTTLKEFCFVAASRLLPPVLTNVTKAFWVKTFAEREGVSLSDSFAYSNSLSDLPMLLVVSHSVAVNLGMQLRQTYTAP